MHALSQHTSSSMSGARPEGTVRNFTTREEENAHLERIGAAVDRHVGEDDLIFFLTSSRDDDEGPVVYVRNPDMDPADPSTWVKIQKLVLDPDARAQALGPEAAADPAVPCWKPLSYVQEAIYNVELTRQDDGRIKVVMGVVDVVAVEPEPHFEVVRDGARLGLIMRAPDGREATLDYGYAQRTSALVETAASVDFLRMYGTWLESSEPAEQVYNVIG